MQNIAVALIHKDRQKIRLFILNQLFIRLIQLVIK